MGSGKTTELFRQLERVEIAGGKTLLFKPEVDNRSQGVKTHSGSERTAIPIKKAQEIFEFLEDDIRAVGIEEAQFLDDDICGVVRVLSMRGLRVIISGLDLDRRARPFGPMPFLLAQAEYVMKLQAVCMTCGADASRTKRKVEVSDDQNLVGGMESYEPACVECHERWLAEQKGREF
jgi:thymidine kinase